MSEKRSLQEIIKWEKRYQAVGLEKLCAWDFAHDNGQNPAATGVARKYADHFEELRQDGTGLSIFGGAGAGKSYLAAEIVSDLTDRGYHCLFTRTCWCWTIWVRNRRPRTATKSSSRS